MKMIKRTGINRVIYAARYSYQGLKYNIINEAAFRQEVILALALIPITFIVDVSKIERILLILSLVLVLIVELLNTAVEAAVDRVGLEFNALSGLAKDTGSAAVFITLFLWGYIWVAILFF